MKNRIKCFFLRHKWEKVPVPSLNIFTPTLGEQQYALFVCKRCNKKSMRSVCLDVGRK